MFNDELPVVDDVSEITKENHPEMYKELRNCSEEGDVANG